eukprot:726676-Lingulodinium_polyedra.AAC.1
MGNLHCATDVNCPKGCPVRAPASNVAARGWVGVALHAGGDVCASCPASGHPLQCISKPKLT